MVEVEVTDYAWAWVGTGQPTPRLWETELKEGTKTDKTERDNFILRDSEQSLTMLDGVKSRMSQTNANRAWCRG
jgi:hypothetical protein